MGSGSSAQKAEKPKNSLVLYEIEASCPCRAAMLTAELAGIQLQYERVDLSKGEQLKPEFIKMNPEHTLPTLKDGDLILWESRAIMRYLMNRYATGHSLYPLDPVKRSTIDRLLDWDMMHVYQPMKTFCYPQIFKKEDPPEGSEDEMKKTVDDVNTKLEDKKYLTGDTLTIADITCICNLAFLELVPWDMSPWKNVEAWKERIKSLDQYKKVHEVFEGMKSGGEEKDDKAEEDQKEEGTQQEEETQQEETKQEE